MSLADPASSSLRIVGLNHRTAPVAIREEIAFDSESIQATLGELTDMPGISGAVIVSTCNRTELYCDAADDAAEELSGWLASHRGLSDDALGALYAFDGLAAIRHTFEVACGLDSMVLGEPQVLGQVKQAYLKSQQLGTAGPLLNLLFQQAFAVAKQVRTNTRIGASSVSVASASVGLAQQIFDRFDKLTALLVGAGDTIELVARHLHGRQLGRMIIANRRVERARGLALNFDAYAISLAEIPAHIAEADIVITSTASRAPLIGRAMVASALEARKRRPIFMVDLAVPRDIATEVGEFEDVYLYTLDDLNDVIVNNQATRAAAADEARTMVADAAREFERLVVGRDTVPMIRALRSGAGELRVRSVTEARKLLEAGRDPAEVLDYLARRLTARLLHLPTQRLREAGEQADIELRRAASILFGLDDTDDNDPN